jgi:SAM-dependent methyltransferase
VKTVFELDEIYFPQYVPPNERLDTLIRRHLRPGDVVLDAGAGHGGAFPYGYRSMAHVVGVDVATEDINRNPNVDERIVADLERLPFEEATFDLVFARSVLEHLERPRRVFAELRRVLRDGGCFIFRTPNRFHYYALVAAVTPHPFHQWYNQRRGFPAADTFPTYYRANSRRRLTKLARETGFEIRELSFHELKPNYLYFHPLAYRAGIAYVHLVEATERLRELRTNIFGVLEARC